MQGQETRTLIFRDENLRSGFSQVPNIVMKDGTLSHAGKILYILLLSYAWRDKECFPGQKLLAENMGCSKSTVIRTLSELKQRKLIKVGRQGLNKPNVYYIEPLNAGYITQFVDKGKGG